MDFFCLFVRRILSIRGAIITLMNAKQQRLKKIKSFLRLQSSPQSITEIFEALVSRLGEDISRKTIERDLDQLIEERSVTLMPGTPARFQIIEVHEIEVILTKDEINTIISNLGEDSEIGKKLKSLII